MEVELTAKREKELAIGKEMEERIFTVRLDFAKDKKSREEDMERNCADLEEQIAELGERVQGEKAQREDANEKLIMRLGDNILKYQERLSMEKKVGP